MKDLLEKCKAWFKLLAIPLAVVILVIMVVLLDKPGQESGSEGGESTPAATESSAYPEGAEKREFKLQKEAVPEIHDLMETYFKARRACDAEALSDIYGGTAGEEELNIQLARLEEEAKFYQDFENLVCYTTPGTEDGDYVIYARFDIKFRQAETLAPSLIVCYGKTAADGSIYLVNDVTEEQSEYMEEANGSGQVQTIAKEVNGGLGKALKSDENLLAVYHMLLDEKEVPETVENSEGQTQEAAGDSESQTRETGESTEN